ncbi:MAG: hypothetical protein WBP45_10875 [Daejeonella sp.]
MRLDKKGEVDIIAPKESNGEFLWRYLNLHTLLDFIYSQEIHFARIDCFLDPLEGMRSSFLRRRHHFANHSDSIDTTLPLDNRETLANERKAFNYIEPKEFEEYQKSQFISCWFHGNRESMAMWELYSSKDSVALKVKSSELIDTISIAAQDFIEKNGFRLHFMGSSIKYLKLNPFDPLLGPINLKYSSMKKDESFKHEQEYRFLISALKEWIKDEDIPFFKLKIQLNKLDFKIICHPLMEEWKKKNIKKLIQNSDLNVQVHSSQIELRK